jgi:hypothetical protein
MPSPMQPITISNRAKHRLTRPSFCRRPLRRVALALLLSSTACGAWAQTVIPGLVAKPDISIYGTLPVNVTPDFGYFAPVLFGYSLGGFYQTRHLIGVEVRGSIQRRQNTQHQESALAGPRLALHFGPFSPYLSVLGGAGNGWRYLNPPTVGVHNPQPVEGTGPQWTIAGGADFHLTHHLGFRLGELSYSEIYLKHWSLSPLNLSAGIVYRIN